MSEQAHFGKKSLYAARRFLAFASGATKKAGGNPGIHKGKQETEITLRSIRRKEESQETFSQV